MIFRQAKNSDAKILSELLVRVARPLKASDFAEDGWEFMLTLVTPEKMLAKIKDENYFIICAEKDRKIVGFITVLFFEKIDQLFVCDSVRYQSVASQLWQQAKIICEQSGRGESYYVKSSSYAIGFYQKLGFSVKGEKQIVNGCSFQLMVYP